MAANDKGIEGFKIDCVYSSCATVTLIEQKNGRRTEHMYYSAPKSVVEKLINNSKVPTVSDFEGWLRDAEAKKDKNKRTELYEEINWWSQR